jgi:hypothetical protein
MIKLLLTLVSIILIVLGVMMAFTIGVLIALAGAINFISRK